MNACYPFYLEKHFLLLTTTWFNINKFTKLPASNSNKHSTSIYLSHSIGTGKHENPNHKNPPPLTCSLRKLYTTLLVKLENTIKYRVKKISQ
jgi:hypothetical protein